MTAFARKVLAELPEPNVPGVTSNNYQKGVPNRERLRQVQRASRPQVQRPACRRSCASASRRTTRSRRRTSTGRRAATRTASSTSLARQFVAGATYVLGADARARRAARRLATSRPARQPPVIGGPSMFELYGITGLPENDPSITGGLTPQTITGFSQLGRQATNPQFQNPFNINPRLTLTTILGPPQREGRRTSTSRSTPRCRTPTRSTGSTPTAASSAARPARRPTTSTTSPTSTSARARSTNWPA